MNELLIGIDWSQAHYDVTILATNGAILTQFQIAKSTNGFQQLAEKIDKFDVPSSQCLIGLETAHNILIDFLWSKRYSVYVVAPSIVNSSRGRFGNSGAHTDKTDARLIADLLRTDRPRFAPWRPDSELLTKIKTKLSLIDTLTQMKVQQTNRLRAILLRVYPQVLHAFEKLGKLISLHFLMAYPAPQALVDLTYADFAAFCRQHRCGRPDWTTKWYRRLQRPQPQANLVLAQAYGDQISFLAQLLLPQVRRKRQATQEVQDLFEQHPDQAIFASLPGAGPLLQPKLLLMFGEDRDRFPSPQDIRALAGTCPVTRQSGKTRRVTFRRACNHDFRATAQQFAVASVKQADWAATYYQAALARGLRKNHAYRCLANRWLGIIWKLWQTRQPYDEAYHLKQLHTHRRLN
jgi:transposase